METYRMEMNPISFASFLFTAFDRGDYSTDDSIAFALPLFKKVLALHESGLVAPFGMEEALRVTGGAADIDESLAHPPVHALYRVQAFFLPGADPDFSGAAPGFSGAGSGSFSPFQPGYRCYEEALGHHDPQTDIFCLGLILGSIAMGLDLYDKGDLALWIRQRGNPSYYYPRIHPTLGRLITEMTEPDRSRRSQDLYGIIRQLDHYRDYPAEQATDLSGVAGWMHKDLQRRDSYILNKLRNRLFDTSRRNRLLYYKPNARLVNLTIGSVPAVLFDRSIRPELLFTWNGELAESMVRLKEILLNKYLRFEDHGYLTASLDTVRLTAQRDVQEYGLSQLKLVIAFLHWHNLKEDPAERIRTPLLLLPASLKKVKKIKEDHYILQAQDNVAEVNPVLAGLLKELYGIRLPDFIDLEEMSPAQFYQQLQGQVEAANQGIRLRPLYQPDIPQLFAQARKTILDFKRRAGLETEAVAAEESRRPADETAKPEPVAAESEAMAADPDPHTWDFDTCQLVLGNFHYKKMSLVRDYNVVIDQQLQHSTFDELFSEQPRTMPEHQFDGNRPDDWYHVITADPSQIRAILQSRAGYSYIIQGPPGTGKSQTITNLIADFAARGKSILFVCEKRAALDVVYHRLKQVGLEELCCYIHDSQRDKRDFIRNLKATYEDYTQHKPDLAALKARRQSLLTGIHHQLDLIRNFHDTHNSEGPDTGISVRLLIERLLELREELPSLSPAHEELLPPYREWREGAAALKLLAEALEEAGGDRLFAAHPFSRVREEIFFSPSPHRTLTGILQQALDTLGEVTAMLGAIAGPGAIAGQGEGAGQGAIAGEAEGAGTAGDSRGAADAGRMYDLGRLSNLVQFAVLLDPLADRGLLALADPASEAARELERRLQRYRRLQDALQKAQEKNGRWARKLEEADLDNAIRLAAKYEHRFLGSLNGPWRKLRHQLNERYDTEGLTAGLSYSGILTALQAEYAAAAQLEAYRQQLHTDYQVNNFDTLLRGIDLLQSKKGHLDLDYLLGHPGSGSLIRTLLNLQQPLSRLQSLLRQCLLEPVAGDLSSLGDELQTLLLNADSLNDWLPALRAFSGLPPGVKTALRQLPLRILQAEAATARAALQRLYRDNRSFSALDFQTLQQAVQRIGEGYTELQELSAGIIRAFVRQRFLQRLELSARAASQLNEEQRQFKKTYTEGRKILENEFGKSKRYKSIRELSEKESGVVLKDIKPVWLMSPYSVSDSLPLDPEHFDVVIFDEASQITLEEGVPALYRSRQAIIVGDEKQMPPTDFFSAGGKDADPDDLDGPGDRMAEEWLNDDAGSLLAQGARKLVSSLLNWHYRSHYETLISYSNHAFYEGSLLTIPDKAIHHREKTPIRITQPEDAVRQADSLFDRSISYHLLTESVYEKRSNAAEAAYIARLVRELLGRNIRESIGIVAFSQEQQRAIEQALDALAAADALFAQQLEEAFNRTENDQFVGLIVKNLENIQGDERDIVIMSVGYGFDRHRRMLMNFGPVNQRGGEKRLNVLFSRAKMHMAVVSSIRYEHITNEYNEGANYLRRFLHYAELISEGRMAVARSVLNSLAPPKEKTEAGTETIIRRQLKEQLEALGYAPAEDVGQSGFKCSLAVKRHPEDADYSVAILIDDEGHYGNGNVIEQYYQRPAILGRSGWKVVPVYAKDWLHQPQQVMEQVLKALAADRSGAAAGSSSVTADPSGVDTGQRPGPEPCRPEPSRLELRDSGDGQFWEGATDGNKLIVRYGKIGSRGQVSLRTFPSDDAARRELSRLEEEQKKKGFAPAL